MTRPPRILGLMSGTSADGIDAALLELAGWPALGSGALFPALPAGVPRGRVVASSFTPFTADLRSAVLQAMQDKSTPAELTQLHWWLGEALAQAAAPLAKDADLIASHGQTVQHHPQVTPERGWARPATLQLGEAAVIAERCGKPVVADFRPADMAAGGVGAPLVPFADWALLAEAEVSRVLLNVGGIANITYLPSLDPAKVIAFDTGPGNCLIDEAAALQGQNFDEGGRLAASSAPHAETLLNWLAHPELHRPPPKATGREVWTFAQLEHLTEKAERFCPSGASEFNEQDGLEKLRRREWSGWRCGSDARAIRRTALGQPGLSVPDLAATATAFTAQTIVDALRFLPAAPDEMVIAGGGAKNPVLLGELASRLAPIPLRTFGEVGWDAYGLTESTREAAAFALLGYCHAQGWANTLPQTTGAKRAVSGGKLTPASLGITHD